MPDINDYFNPEDIEHDKMIDPPEPIDSRMKLWYNTQMGYYELFTPEGKLVPNVGMIVITDNWPDRSCSATIELEMVEVVNERPKP